MVVLNCQDSIGLYKICIRRRSGSRCMSRPNSPPPDEPLTIHRNSLSPPLPAPAPSSPLARYSSVYQTHVVYRFGNLDPFEVECISASIDRTVRAFINRLHFPLYISEFTELLLQNLLIAFPKTSVDLVVINGNEVACQMCSPKMGVFRAPNVPTVIVTLRD